MADIEAARRDLVAALDADRVLADPLALRLYARDASMVEGGCALVVFPLTTEDIRSCVRIARAHGLPIVPRGSGTGLAGAATPTGDALVVVTSKMTRILEIRPEDGLAWVEPGLPNLDLSVALAPIGFTYAPDPSSQQTSSIGGNVNTNAGGPHCLAYGVTSAHVLALDVVLPDGSETRVGSEAPEAAGYDLRGVVVGSEGTLGIVARVCVRILPKPPAVRTMLLDFATVEACAQTVTDIIGRGVVPAAVEMMDQGIVRAAEAFAHAGYPTEAAAILIVEVDGTPGSVEAQSLQVEEAAAANDVGTIRIAADDAERALLWKGRKSAFGAVAQIAPHYHLHDCVVPRTKLTEVLVGVYAIAERHGLIVTNVFHAGDGNLHPLFSFDRTVPGTLERVLEASDEVVRLCVDAGGALVRRTRDRPGEARLHAADVQRGRPGGAGVRAFGVRSRRHHEPEQGVARWRPLRGLRDRARGNRRCRRSRREPAGGLMALIARPGRLRRRDLQLLAKIGLAAILAWWISDLLGADRPAFAAIVPLVALRADDPYGALGLSLFRVAGTVLGILLGIAALAIDPSAPLWLVAATIVVSLLVGLFVRSSNEPINPIAAVTAVVVIYVGKGRADAYGWIRIWETFLGAVVTMAVAAFVWPPDPIAGLREMLGDLRENVSADLRDVARFPGLPLHEADMLLDERLRRSMDTGDTMPTIDRANSGLRWNPRHRRRRPELIALAVPIRELAAMSRYSRSLLWSLMGDPVGDRIRTWPEEGLTAFQEALRHADAAAGDVAEARDPTAEIAAADEALERFASHTGGGEGAQLAVDLHGGTRAMIRVLKPETTARLRALSLERYGPEGAR